MSHLKLICGNKESLLGLQYNQGAMMLAKDSQQIYFDLDNSRRVLSGIVYLMTQYDRDQLTAPCDKLYYVIQSGNLYYYRSDSWVCVNSHIIKTTYADMQNMQSVDQNNIYIDTTNNDVYYGLNINNSISWILLGSSSLTQQVNDLTQRVNELTNIINILLENSSNSSSSISSNSSSSN